MIERMIIPVIDLLDGQVVHAIRGERDRYQPVSSTLCNAPDPNSVIEAYFRLYPFTKIYIADLNAIQGTGNHDAWLQDVAARYPQTAFWVDTGMREPVTADNIAPVIGTENNISAEALLTHCRQYPNAILSLDFNSQGQLHNPAIMQMHADWPDRLIVMLMSRVGTGKGIDRDALALVMKQAADKQVYVGGGVASTSEVTALLDEGIRGVLIATALHSGTISSADISLLMST